MAPAPPPPPYLPENLIVEILLLLPPDEPAVLFRAAAVCKTWCRLISGPGFHRRYREFHRSLPMLGFLGVILPGLLDLSRIVPTSDSCWPVADRYRCRAIDAHHGRVLLRCPGKPSSSETTALVVFEPISEDRRELPVPTRWRHWSDWDWNAALLCSAAAADGPCDCNGRRGEPGPFLVVFIDSYTPCVVFVSTYSSDTGTWSEAMFRYQGSVSITPFPCAHVGNALYISSPFTRSSTALKYDFYLRETSVIQLPPDMSTRWQPHHVLIRTEDGGLGYATVHEFKLYLWSMKEDGPQVDAGWTQSRVVDLEMLLQSNGIFTSPALAGFVDGIGVVFLRAEDENVMFTVDLKTKNLKKVSNGKFMYNILPYMSFSFHNPELGAACMDEEPSTIGSDA